MLHKASPNMYAFLCDRAVNYSCLGDCLPRHLPPSQPFHVLDTSRPYVVAGDGSNIRDNVSLYLFLLFVSVANHCFEACICFYTSAIFLNRTVSHTDFMWKMDLPRKLKP